MGYDLKYGKVTTEHGDIGEDEPVFVFRGRDKLLLKILSYYLFICAKAGTTDFHIGTVLKNIKIVRQWQADNPDRVVMPASKNYQRRIEGDDV
jgi:hypothetical protein